MNSFASPKYIVLYENNKLDYWYFYYLLSFNHVYKCQKNKIAKISAITCFKQKQRDYALKIPKSLKLDNLIKVNDAA